MKLVPRTTPIDADDNVGRGMDFALVILVFLGIGWGLDRALDTRPAFMIGCTVFAVVGQFVRMWYLYDASMRTHEAARLADRQVAPRASVVLEDLSYPPLEIPRDADARRAGARDGDAARDADARRAGARDGDAARDADGRGVTA